MNDAGFLWELFEETGSVELYLAYRLKTSTECADDKMPGAEGTPGICVPAE